MIEIVFIVGVLIIVNFVIGGYLVIQAVGEGLAILIGDGVPVWMIYVAFFFWPITMIIWWYWGLKK